MSERKYQLRSKSQSDEPQSFRPEHRSTEFLEDIFRPAGAIARSPPRSSISRVTHVEFAVDTEEDQSPSVHQESTGPEGNTNTMANITISNVINTSRKTVVPQFISPPTFHPCRNKATEFLRTYDRTAIANGWDEALKIAYFETFLDGAANLWFQEYKTNKPDNEWADVCEDFKKEFEDTNYQRALKKKIEERKQSRTETVVGFLYELRVLYHEYRENMDMEEFLAMFSKGLTEDNFYHYYWLTSPPSTPPGNLEKLKEIAITIDNAPKRPSNEQTLQERGQEPRYPRYQNYDAPRLPAPHQQGQTYGLPSWQHHPGYRNPVNNQRQASNNVPNQQRAPPRRGTYRNGNNSPVCYNCGRPGHFAATCRIRPQHPNGTGWQR